MIIFVSVSRFSSMKFIGFEYSTEQKKTSFLYATKFAALAHGPQQQHT